MLLTLFIRDCESVLNVKDEVLILDDRFALAESHVWLGCHAALQW